MLASMMRPLLPFVIVAALAISGCTTPAATGTDETAPPSASGNAPSLTHKTEPDGARSNAYRYGSPVHPSDDMRWDFSLLMFTLYDPDTWLRK